MKNNEKFEKFRNYTMLIFTLFPILVNGNNENSHQWDSAYILVLCLFFSLVATTTAYLVYKFGCHCTRPETPESREVDVKVVEVFPTSSMAEVIKLHGLNKVDQLVCAVCLSELKDEDILNMLPVCLHVFHASCIEPWLASHSTCPTCRASLEHKSLPSKLDVDGVYQHDDNGNYVVNINEGC